jgi:hypothetical protein
VLFLGVSAHFCVCAERLWNYWDAACAGSML